MTGSGFKPKDSGAYALAGNLLGCSLGGRQAFSPVRTCGGSPVPPSSLQLSAHSGAALAILNCRLVGRLWLDGLFAAGPWACCSLSSPRGSNPAVWTQKVMPSGVSGILHSFTFHPVLPDLLTSRVLLGLVPFLMIAYFHF